MVSRTRPIRTQPYFCLRDSLTCPRCISGNDTLAGHTWDHRCRYGEGRRAVSTGARGPLGPCIIPLRTIPIPAVAKQDHFEGLLSREHVRELSLVKITGITSEVQFAIRLPIRYMIAAMELMTLTTCTENTDRATITIEHVNEMTRDSPQSAAFHGVYAGLEGQLMSQRWHVLTNVESETIEPDPGDFTRRVVMIRTQQNSYGLKGFRCDECCVRTALDTAWPQHSCGRQCAKSLWIKTFLQ